MFRAYLLHILAYKSMICIFDLLKVHFLAAYLLHICCIFATNILHIACIFHASNSIFDLLKMHALHILCRFLHFYSSVLHMS
jgi:hypothetical protein